MIGIIGDMRGAGVDQFMRVVIAPIDADTLHARGFAHGDIEDGIADHHRLFGLRACFGQRHMKH